MAATRDIRPIHARANRALAARLRRLCVHEGVHKSVHFHDLLAKRLAEVAGAPDQHHRGGVRGGFAGLKERPKTRDRPPVDDAAI